MVPRNDQLAMKWYERVGKYGLGEAHFEIAMLQLKKSAIPTNMISAYAHLSVATSLGRYKDYSADYELEKLIKELTTKQIENGQILAKKMWERIQENLQADDRRVWRDVMDKIRMKKSSSISIEQWLEAIFHERTPPPPPNIYLPEATHCS